MLRVLRMFPHSIKSRSIPNKNLYHSSNYAELNDARWETYKAEAVARFDEELNSLQESLAKQKELLGIQS